MPKISEFFQLNASQPQLDFVDVDTDIDTPLFLDPHAMGKMTDAWSQDANRYMQSFFQAVLDAIVAGDPNSGRILLDNLHEPNETCLGLSKGRPDGRGVGQRQADQLFDRILASNAAQNGLLEELSDFELFIPLIGRDKISDITTNIIRKKLIQYTAHQCELHGIEINTQVPSGMCWNYATGEWEDGYVNLPLVDGKKTILVPKAIVRWEPTFSHSRYYNHFVLNFLQAQHLQRGGGLVSTWRGRPYVSKEKLKERYPIDKEFLANFSADNPQVLAMYKNQMGIPVPISNEEIDHDHDERRFAAALKHGLAEINPGNAEATRFHKFVLGAFQFIFYPDLRDPHFEAEIHQGRKRVDISYTNACQIGFWARRRTENRTNAVRIPVECKNYQKEMANPELDQIAGRFSPNRGRLGFVVGRGFDNRQRFVERCRDTAMEDRGFVIALVDEDIYQLLTFIENGQRSHIDRFLESRFSELIN